MVMNFSWALLPDDLLCRIAVRLGCLEDMLAFAAVCTTWRTAYTGIKSFWRPKMPWLILAENNDDNPQCIRTVVNLNNNKRYQMKLHETFGRRCWGCEHGWIFTLGLDSKPHLFNPLTRAQLSLPSILALPFEDFDTDSIDHTHRQLVRRNYIQKVHVICVPPNDEILVMVIFKKSQYGDTGSEWAYTRPGAFEWNSLKVRFAGQTKQRSVQTIVTCGTIVVAIHEDGTLLVFRVEDFSIARNRPNLISSYLFDLEEAFSMEFCCAYLVVSSGDLLLVLRNVSQDDSDGEFIDDPTISYVTWGFKVFAFDAHQGEWFAEDDLGDMALFVGNNTAISVRSSECTNCKPNCIYFTDERSRDDPNNFLGHDSGIFNMKDRSIERVYHGVDILSQFCPPFWFMPKLA